MPFVLNGNLTTDLMSMSTMRMPLQQSQQQQPPPPQPRDSTEKPVVVVLLHGVCHAASIHDALRAKLLDHGYESYALHFYRGAAHPGSAGTVATTYIVICGHRDACVSPAAALQEDMAAAGVPGVKIVTRPEDAGHCAATLGGPDEVVRSIAQVVEEAGRQERAEALQLAEASVRDY